jgi:hypothetical protein
VAGETKEYDDEPTVRLLAVGEYRQLCRVSSWVDFASWGVADDSGAVGVVYRCVSITWIIMREIPVRKSRADDAV